MPPLEQIDLDATPTFSPQHLRTVGYISGWIARTSLPAAVRVF